MKNTGNIYLSPEAEVILVEAIDVITTSEGGNGGNGGGSNETVGPWVDID